MKILHEGIKNPNLKMNSCVEGRIFSAFSYLIGNEKNRKDLYYFLAECMLRYSPMMDIVHQDPWYYQPLSIITRTGYDLESNEGFECLCSFMMEYGIECTVEIFGQSENLIALLENAFTEGKIPIAVIDQYFFKKSKKYKSNINTYHALLLYGIDSEEEILYVADSGESIESRYAITYDELKEAVVNPVYFINRINEVSINTSVNLKKNKCLYFDKESCVACLEFISEIKERINQDKVEMKFWLEGYVYNISYKILPYIEKSIMVYDKLKIRNLIMYFEILRRDWELLGKVFQKAIISKTNVKNSELIDRIRVEEIIIMNEIEKYNIGK